MQDFTDKLVVITGAASGVGRSLAVVMAEAGARVLAADIDGAGLLETKADSFLEIRDLAMFELFYSSGLRLSELAALNMEDIDLQEKTLQVLHGKGNKQRNLPVGSKALEALKKWFNYKKTKHCSYNRSTIIR